MTTDQTTLTNLRTSMNRFQSLVESLTEEQMAVRSLCPDWDVKGVILHVVGIEHILVDWLPQSEDEPPAFAAVGPFLAGHAGDDVAALKTLTAETFERRRANLADLSNADLDRRCMSPVGPSTYGGFMAVRNFDIWVHHRDITTPLGLPSDDGGPSAEAALDQVHHSLGYIVGKKVGLPDGMSITFDVGGPIERQMHVAVDGRAKVVPRLEGPPSVVISTDLITFMQLACGRLDPQAQITAGTISWTGDQEWGREAASRLAFTM
ncbi:MAG: maleylpyruvate isomerase family mycothiol-dependent enzyme [Acidimicrobiia bacterium]|nr:maleylpyruvate isomerase family mycothiol-dependent enzyme [Acidimicrobiia bacterium]